MYTAFPLMKSYSLRFNKNELSLENRLHQLAKHEGVSEQQLIKQWVVERLSAPAERMSPVTATPATRDPAVAESLNDLQDELVGLRRDLRRVLTAAFSRGLSEEDKEQVAELVEQLLQTPDKT